MNEVFNALSSLFAAVLVNGRTGAIEELNESFTLLTGWTRRELRGKQLDNIVPERSRAVHKKHRATYAEHPEPRPMGADREVFLACKDGSEVRVWIGLAPIGDDLVVATILPQDVERPGPLNPAG